MEANYSSYYSVEDGCLTQELVRLDRKHSLHLGEVAMSQSALTYVRAFLKAACTRQNLDFSAITWAYALGIKKLTRFAQVHCL